MTAIPHFLTPDHYSPNRKRRRARDPRNPLRLPALHELLPLARDRARGPDEITAIAAHLRMSEEAFRRDHTRLRPDRLGLSLLENADGSCAWLDGRDCRLQRVKPAQCRAFPNDWNFPGWREKCEAVPTLVRSGV